MTMLIAGHETSAAVLTWTFYLLSKVLGVYFKGKTCDGNDDALL